MSKTVHIYNLQGEKQADSIQFGSFPKKAKMSLIHSLVVNFLAKKRSGSANTKTRSEVRGGGKKPWSQKGTGRARAGSIRSPLFRGGGVVFGPKPRSYGGKVNKKTKIQALKSALLNKGNHFYIIKNLDVKNGKTKEVVEIMCNFKVKSALFVDEKCSDKLVRAAKNIKTAKTSSLNSLNVYDITKYESLFISENAGKKLAEVMK